MDPKRSWGCPNPLNFFCSVDLCVSNLILHARYSFFRFEAPLKQFRIRACSSIVQYVNTETVTLWPNTFKVFCPVVDDETKQSKMSHKEGTLFLKHDINEK